VNDPSAVAEELRYLVEVLCRQPREPRC